MATVDAIAGTSKAILGLLQDAWDPSTSAPVFKLFHASDFENPGSALGGGSTYYGVSLYLYRIGVNGTMRTQPRQLKQDGKYYRAPLMLDLYYLLTAWADDVEKQQRLLGWCMRVLYDTPVLPAAHINAHTTYDRVFQPHETVELTCETLSLQDMASIWDKLKPKLQTSATYLARMVTLESKLELSEAKAVQTREYAFDGMAPPLA